MRENAVIEDLDLSGLPSHLHEWARTLEAEASRHQREADDMKSQARVLAIIFPSSSILGDENHE
jgi:hypothetical protein